MAIIAKKAVKKPKAPRLVVVMGGVGVSHDVSARWTHESEATYKKRIKGLPEGLRPLAEKNQKKRYG